MNLEMKYINTFEEYCDAIILKDLYALDVLLDESFQLIEKSGMRLRKEKMLFAVQNGLLRYQQVNTLQYQIKKIENNIIFININCEIIVLGLDQKKYRRNVIQKVVLKEEKQQIRILEVEFI